MRGYRTAWLNVVYVVGGMGVAAALLNDRILVNVGVAVLVGLAAGLTTYVVQEALSIASCRRRALTAAAAGTAGCCAIAGLAMLVGQGTLLVLVLFALTSPPAVRRYLLAGRRITSPRSLPPIQEGGDLARVTTQTDVSGTVCAHSLTDAELCLAWRASSAALELASSDLTKQAELVTARQNYLDELERRDPPGFQCWLADGARPDSDPGPYLRPAATPSHPDRPGQPHQ